MGACPNPSTTQSDARHEKLRRPRLLCGIFPGVAASDELDDDEWLEGCIIGASSLIVVKCGHVQ